MRAFASSLVRWFLHAMHPKPRNVEERQASMEGAMAFSLSRSERDCPYPRGPLRQAWKRAYRDEFLADDASQW